jgi:hypothetical protein
LSEQADLQSINAIRVSYIFNNSLLKPISASAVTGKPQILPDENAFHSKVGTKTVKTVLILEKMNSARNVKS